MIDADREPARGNPTPLQGRGDPIALPLISAGLVAGGCAAVAVAFGRGLWLDALLIGAILTIVGLGAIQLMLRHIGGKPRRAPGGWLLGSGIILIAVLGLGLALVFLMGRDPLTTLLTAVAVGWTHLWVGVVLVRRSLRDPRGESTGPEREPTDAEPHRPRKPANSQPRTPNPDSQMHEVTA